MAFWGIEVKPGRPFTHHFESMRGRLHISQASLGVGSATKKCLVQCNVGSKSPVFLCSLLPDKNESCPLNLEFAEVDEVMFSVIGPQSVYLTGYFLGNGWHSNPNDDSDSYGEDIADTENEESNRHSEEDEYDDSFIDDAEPEVCPPSPNSNGGVVTEGILDSNKRKNAKAHRRLKKKYLLSESEDENNSQQQRIVNHRTGKIVLESDDEDILPISPLVNCKTTAKNTNLEAEEKGNKETGETGKKKTEDYVNSYTQSDKKSDAIVDGEPERQSDLPFNSLLLNPSTEVVGPETGAKTKKKRKERSKEQKPLECHSANNSNVLKADKTYQVEDEAHNMSQGPSLRNQQDQKPVNDKEADLPHSLLSAEMGPENGAKPKKRRKERGKEGNTVKADSSYYIRLLKEEEDQQDGAKADNTGQDLSVRNEQDQNSTNDKILDDDAGHFADKKQPEEKKIKKKKRSKPKKNEGDVNTNIPLFSMEERNVSIMEIEGENEDTKSSQVRTLSNGLVIEQLEMGKPDGKIATPGKKLRVHYVGKLRKNGEIFDSNIDRAPFKFRLGSGKVLKGWNDGLNGMRVGDKRRLIIPPSMGYGSQGDGKNIPPHSWLEFDVELVAVR